MRRASVGIEGDEVLLSRVRDDGDVHAFGCLYERHAPAARRFARSLCRNDADADDLTAEVFTALLASLRRGKGPSQLVLPYVFASIRHRHWRTARRLGHEAAVAATYGARTEVSDTMDLVEADVVRTALATLPDDVQLLIWRTEVADESVAEVVERNGTSAHNVAVSRHRARRALGTAYLAQHAEPDGGLAGLDAECQATLSQLAALVRTKVGVRRRRRIERHLAACASCARIHERLARVNTRLRAHPQLPWELWTAGVTSAIKAQLSGGLGTSAVTIAGSGALAVAVRGPGAECSSSRVTAAQRRRLSPPPLRLPATRWRGAHRTRRPTTPDGELGRDRLAPAPRVVGRRRSAAPAASTAGAAPVATGTTTPSSSLRTDDGPGGGQERRRGGGRSRRRRPPGPRRRSCRRGGERQRARGSARRTAMARATASAVHGARVWATTTVVTDGRRPRIGGERQGPRQGPRQARRP